MPLRSFLGALRLTCIFLSGVLTAQNPAHVNHITVRNAGSAIEVEIHTVGSIAAPNTQAITGPDRIVVDFPGALPSSWI